MAKGNRVIIRRNTVMQTGSGHGGLDDEGSRTLDITMYDEFKEGTCNCNDDYCKEQSGTCCAVDDNGDDIDDTFEGRLNLVEFNAMEAFQGSVGGGTANPDTSAVDATFAQGQLKGARSNSAGVLWDELRDPEHWDFRPREGSNFLTAGIGAYGVESSKTYWIPGRQEYRASTPIPADGATGVNAVVDVMFLQGRDATGHRVRVACSEALLETADSVELTGDDNVVSPPAELMRPGRTLYWTVDTLATVDGQDVVYSGETWSFTLADHPGPAPRPQSPCRRWDSSDTPAVLPAASNTELFDGTTITIPSSSYPSSSGFTLRSVRICMNATAPGAGWGKTQIRARSPTNKNFVQLARYRGGDSDWSDTCFTDSSIGKLPADNTGAPFAGDWEPFQLGPGMSSLLGLVTDFGDTGGILRLGGKNHGPDAAAGEEGSIDSWSVEMCYDGGESVREEWARKEQERVAAIEKDSQLEWCVTGSPTAAPSSRVPTAKPSSSPVVPATKSPVTASPTATAQVPCKELRGKKACKKKKQRCKWNRKKKCFALAPVVCKELKKKRQCKGQRAKAAGCVYKKKRCFFQEPENAGSDWEPNDPLPQSDPDKPTIFPQTEDPGKPTMFGDASTKSVVVVGICILGAGLLFFVGAVVVVWTRKSEENPPPPPKRPERLEGARE